MLISSEVLRKIAHSHAQYEVDSMSLDELKSAAIDSRLSEMSNAAGGVDQVLLLENLIQRFDGDTDTIRQYMVAHGVTDHIAEQAIVEFMT